MTVQLEVQRTSGEPFVTQLQNQLRGSIRRRQLKPGQKIPSIRELSETCGVSVGIVRQAINTLTAEGFLRTHPGRGVFVAEPAARCGNVALVLPTLDLEQMGRIVHGVKSGLPRGSARLMVQAADFDFDHEVELLDNLDVSFCSGAIIYPPPLESYVAPLRELRRRGVPFVLVDTAFSSLHVDAVTTDSVELGRLAMQHLLDQGHRHIGVVDHDADATTIQEIREGMDEALQRFGLRFGSIPRVQIPAAELSREEPYAAGRAGATDLLKSHRGLTALIGINDNISMGCYQAARGVGLRVPSEMSLVAVGDMKVFEVTEPPITAVSQDHVTMGQMAAQRLMAILDGKGGSPVAARVTPQLICRVSTAAPRSS